MIKVLIWHLKIQSYFHHSSFHSYLNWSHNRIKEADFSEFSVKLCRCIMRINNARSLACLGRKQESGCTRLSFEFTWVHKSCIFIVKIYFFIALQSIRLVLKLFNVINNFQKKKTSKLNVKSVWGISHLITSNLMEAHSFLESIGFSHARNVLNSVNFDGLFEAFLKVTM